MKLFKKAKKGFTLVELVVVIAVIAILSAVSVGAYFGITASANDSRATQEAKAFHTALMVVVNKPNSGYTMTTAGIAYDDPIATASAELIALVKAETGVTYYLEGNEPTVTFVDPEEASGTAVNAFTHFTYTVAKVTKKVLITTGAFVANN